jgi:CHASE1-domain containing sensor protein
VWLGDAASAVTGVDAHTSLLLAIIGLLSTVLVAALGGVASVLVARANRRNAEDAAPIRGMSFRDYVIGELAVTKQRLDDHDDALAIMEHRQDKGERALDIENPTWSHPPEPRD